MKILALSGWGQPHDALAEVAPDAYHFSYADYKTIDSAISAIGDAGSASDVVIGWSLGGQLALRAISAGLLQPEKLVLIAVPFQFVQTSNNKMGMPRDKFEKFYDNYSRNPLRTLTKAWELTALGDKNHESIRNTFSNADKEAVLAKDWLNWLGILDGFSCKELDFTNVPQSLLLHGQEDSVVSNSQSLEFIKEIPQAKHIIFPQCGHAPHLHDVMVVKRHIEEFLYV